jgi:putative membrane protein
MPYEVCAPRATHHGDRAPRTKTGREHPAAPTANRPPLTDLQGGCGRIKGTPIPFSNAALIHRIVAVYCFALPFGIADSVYRMTPFVVALVAYAFFGLDAIGDEIEEPFGLDANDLPLSQISRTIDIDLLQSLGEVEVPDAIEPRGGFIS